MESINLCLMNFSNVKHFKSFIIYSVIESSGYILFINHVFPIIQH